MIFEDGSWVVDHPSVQLFDEVTYTITSEKAWSYLIVTDMGNGTWTAESDLPGVINIFPDGSWQLTDPAAQNIDNEVYIITTT